MSKSRSARPRGSKSSASETRLVDVSDNPLLNASDADDEAPSRYVVGVDLGTTNSAVCYVDAEEETSRVRTFAVPQLTAPGQVEDRETLPSFHYQPFEGEFARPSLRLPWTSSAAGQEKQHVVGVFARDHGSQTPGRMVASAKSWLSHAGVDRTAELLPWRPAEDVDRLSPIDVSARYLEHIRRAWDHRHAEHPLEQQDLILTLPASFDEVARELTIEAAARASLNRVVLVEEPQAAFYAWIDAHQDEWENLVQPGQKILVCDIGGGTSDFTLIRVRRGEGNAIQFHRVAVGDHLILGGDNLDLALAKHFEQKLKGENELAPRQWDVLVRACRNVKETLLGTDPPARLTVNLPGSGAKLIGGGLNVVAERDEVGKVLLEGFFPQVSLDDKPTSRQSGFQEFGLPYAPDPAVTKYLASFLTNHRHTGEDANPPAPSHDPARPDIVLFNGGLFGSHEIQHRILSAIESWFRQSPDDAWAPTVLHNERLDLAVARGAAYYGMVRRGQGVKIAAGLARSYYIGVESEPPSAVCLVPGTAEPGQDIELPDRTFRLRVSQPVEFPLFVSSTRLADPPGEIFAIDREQMKPLAPIRTVLKTRRRSEQGEIEVQLHARLTEIGTLDLWCGQEDSDRRWRLQFDVRSATQTDRESKETTGEREGTIDETAWSECENAIEAVFGSQDKTPSPDSQAMRPENLVKHLASALETPRQDWPPSLLRRIWAALMDEEAGRRQSAKHEARWLNLLGYALRPGYGLAVDDWRVAQTWRTVQGRLIHSSPACRNESWILWRRVAGGLSAGQQRAVVEPLLAPIRALHRRMTSAKGRSDGAISPQESHEAWRLLGSLELLPVSMKNQIGGMIVDLIGKRKLASIRPALIWALGRLGQRTPVYGPLNTVIPAEKAAAWIKELMKFGDEPMTPLAVMQMARRTDDRYRDVGAKSRTEIVQWMENTRAPQRFIELVRDGGGLVEDEQDRVFGEALPKGLRLS